MLPAECGMRGPTANPRERDRMTVRTSLATRVAGPALVTVLLATGCAPDAPATGIAIQNVTVIDAASGVRENQTVVVRGDTIVSVAEAGSAPQVTEIVDGTGRYLIPGLWDMHVHLTYTKELTPLMAELFLKWGITSIRDTGGLLDEVTPVVAAMRAEGPWRRASSSRDRSWTGVAWSTTATGGPRSASRIRR